MLFRLTIVFLFFIVLVQAQDTVLIKKHFAVQDIHKSFRYFKSNNIQRADSAYAFFKKHPEKTHRLQTSFVGIVKEPYWFFTTIKNESDLTDFIFEIKHSHLRQLELYQIIDNKIVSKGIVGELFPFNTRPLQHRYFTFPITLKSHASSDLLLYVNHENSLALPTALWFEKAFHENDYKFNLVAGSVIGFLTFCMFISLACYVIVKSNLFLWYSLYLFFCTLYLFTDLGFSFQFIYPTLTRFDGPFSVYSPLLMFIGLVKFIQELLSLKQYHFKLYWCLTVIILLFVTLIAVDLLFQESWRKFSYYFLPPVFCIVLLSLMLLVLAGILSLKTKRKMAIFFFISYVPMLTVLCFSILGNAFGMVAYTFLNPIYLGVLFEVSVLSIALISQYKDIYYERSSLQQKVVEQQREYYQHFIDGIEKERNRIAGDLHDDVGSKLSYLKRAVFMSDDENSKLLDEVIQDLRNISHDLAPTSAQVSGLLPLIERLIDQAQKESTVAITLRTFDYQENLKPGQIIQLYRILQEAINNALKHAKATKLDIQLFGYEKELAISIEDDGRGFDTSQPPAGLGLNQLKIRTENLLGRIEINSQLGKGTMILLQVPLK